MFKDIIAQVSKNSIYSGNRSVDIIKRQVSPDTVFSIDDEIRHRKLRTNVMTHFSKIKITDIDKLVDEWLDNVVLKNKELNVHDIVHEIVIHAFRDYLCPGTDLDEIRLCINDFLHDTRSLLKTRHNYILNIPDDSLIDHDDIITLMKVGYSNIHSMLSSLITRLAENYDELYPELIDSLENNRLKFNTTKNTAASRFFMATYQLAPPVWVNARKCCKEPVEVKLSNGNYITFNPHSLILSPNFYLLRHQYGSDFNPDKFKDVKLNQVFPSAFSEGVNSCVGRQLALPIMETVIRKLLDYRIEIIESCDKYVGHVAIKYKYSPVIMVKDY